MKRWLIFAILSVISLIGLSSLLIDGVLEGLIESKLRKAILLDERSTYDIQYESIHTRFLKGSILISGLHLFPRQPENSKSASITDKALYDIRLKEFALSGLSTWRLLFHGEIAIQSIFLDQVAVKVYSAHRAKSGPTAENLARDIIAPTLEFAFLDSLKLENARFDFYQIAQDTTKLFSFDSLTFSVYELYIDSGLIRSGEYFDYQGLSMKVKNIELDYFPQVALKLKDLSLNPNEGRMQITGLEIKNKEDKYEFMKHQAFETDWISLKLDKVILENLDFNKFHESGELEMDLVELINPAIELYRDKRLPDQPFRFVPLPFRTIRELGFIFHVNQLQVKNASLSYVEWAEYSVRPGVLKMDHLEANVRNLTSNNSRLMINDTMIVESKGRLMNSGVISVELKAAILDSNDFFTLTGKLSNIDFVALNPLVEHQAMVRFNEGKINSIVFELEGNNVESAGTLDLDYEGLKNMTLLRNKTELEANSNSRKKKEGKRLLSFLANTYVLNSYHPGMIDYYQGRIRFKRDQGKAIFHFTLHSLITGLKSSMLPNLEDDWSEIKRQHQKSLREERLLKKKSKRNK
ncbi:MAG: hypothetical protein RIC15_04785 [Vicingaceae bacterium]